MPDYNLGRAHGEVVITADTKDVTRGLGEYERAQKSAGRAAGDAARIEQELTRRREEATHAANLRRDAENEYKRVMADSTATATQQTRAEHDRNQARGVALQAAKRAAEAERAFQSALRGGNDEVKKFIRNMGEFTTSHNRANRAVSDFKRLIDDHSKSFDKLGSVMSTTAPILAKVIGLLAAGGAAGGAIGLLGGGGIQGILTATEAIKDFSGAIFLMPAVLGGAATVLGTLAVAFNGVGDALSSMDDPAKFTEAVRKLAPAAAQAVTIIASFRDAIKGAMAAVQQSLFQPIVDQIEPLIRTWLPALMHAGQQVASVLGQAGRVVAEWLRQPAQMQAFTQFITNLVNGLNGLMPAITPVLDAFKTLSVVGSQFFPQLAAIIVQIATAFNNWVQGAAQSGALQQWIQTAITSFEQLFQAIGNVLHAAENIGRAFEAAGSKGFLQWLVEATQKFREWTESAQGVEILTTFFQNLNQASHLLGPVLVTIGVAVLQLVNNLLQLGINMGPGIQTFFTTLATALNSLGQSLAASGPALGQILVTLGQALLQIVQQVGPQLPTIFQNLATALTNVAPAAVAVAGAIAQVMANLTPGEIEVILGIVAAFQAFSTILPIITALGAAIEFLAANPIVLLVAAVAAAAVLIITHWDDVKAAAQAAWDKMQEWAAWIGNAFSNIWSSIASSVSGAWDAVKNAVSTGIDSIRQFFANLPSEAWQWGVNLVQALAKGLEDSIPGLRQVVDAVAGLIPDSWKTQSPAKRGPLSQMSPQDMGARLGAGFAAGIASTAGGVGDASSTVAGGTTTGMSFSSAGAAGRSGKGTSGFDQWIESITQDLQSWSALAQGAFGLFKSVADVMVNTAKVTASLWNGGDNPMTQPGGVFGTAPGLTPEQQQIPGVANMPAMHGQAPIPELRPGAGAPAGAPPVPQQGIPGIPQAPGTLPGAAPPLAPAPAPPGPGSVGGAPPAPLPPPAPGTAGVPAGPSAVPNQQAAGTAGRVGVARGATPEKVAMGIVEEGRRRGLSEAQIQAAGMIASDETNFGTPGFNSSGGNASVGGVGGTYQQSSQAGWGDPNQILDPGYSISKFYDIYQENLRRFPGIDPINVAILTQNPQLVTQFGIKPEELATGSEYGRQTAAAWSGPRGGQATFQRGLASAIVQPPAPIAPPPGGAAPAAPGTGAPGPGSKGGSKGNPETGIGVIGGAAAIVGAAVDAVVTGTIGAGVAGLGAASTAFGSATGQEATPDYTKGQFIKTADGKFVLIPPGADPAQMLQRFPGGTVVDSSKNPLPAPVPTPPPGAAGAAGPPGVAPSLGPRGIPSGQVGQITPVTGMEALSQFWGGILPSTYPGHQEEGGKNLGVDWGAFKGWTNRPAQAYGGQTGAAIGTESGGSRQLTREEADRMTAYAKWVGTQPGVEQVIWMNPYTGEKVGYHNGQPVGPDMPGSTDKGYYRDDWTGHSQHVHTRMTQNLGAPAGSPAVSPTGASTPLPTAPPPAAPTVPGQPGATPPSTDSSWMNVPAGWDISKPIPNDVRQQHGIPDSVPPIFYAAQPGSVTNVPTQQAPGTVTPEGSVVSPGGTISVPLPGQQPGMPSTQQPLPFGAKTPMDAFTQGMSAATSVAGDAFTVFNDFITNIKAGADMFDTIVRGFENTEDVNKFIDNFQTFIKTGADIAKLVGDIGGIAGAAGGASGMPGGGSPGAAVQAVAGIVQGALEATNMAIDMGQMVWQQATKYAVGIFAGSMLGGVDTGPLGGNVRMLLNTNTGQLQAYSEDNPLNKQTHNLPAWMARSYGGPNPNAQPNTQQTQVNIYTGPGPDARNLISDTMWLVGTGAPSVASVAGQD